MASKLIVHTTATATVTEQWMIEIEDGADVNQLIWNGWEEALASGKARKIGVIEIETRGHRNRKVESVVTT